MGGRVREDREASYGECLSPFGRSFNALKHPHRVVHLVSALGLHIPYIKAHILDSGLSFLWATKAIRICERGEPSCCIRRLPLLLLRKRRVPTHFYEERETLQKVRGSSGEQPSSSSSLIFALQAKIHSFFVKELLDQSYKIYQDINSINPNLMIVVH